MLRPSCLSLNQFPVFHWANPLIKHKLLHLPWQQRHIPTGFNHSSANEISMANAQNSPSLFFALLCFQQGLRMAELYPGFVWQRQRSWAAPQPHLGFATRDQRRRGHPGWSERSQQSGASWSNLAPDKWGTESQGGFGNPQQSPRCWNDGGRTWHLRLEGWSTGDGGNWMGCGMAGWNRLTASRVCSLAPNSQILTPFLQTHKSWSRLKSSRWEESKRNSVFNLIEKKQ